MNNSEEYMEWEKEAPYLASLPRKMPYRVPDQYFSNLPEHINQAVFLANLTKGQIQQGFKVPEGYFEALTTQINSQIAVREFRTLVQEDGFTTPPHYFDQLNDRILSKVSNQSSPVKIWRLWQSEAMKYVSAACFIVMVASGLYLNQQHNAKLMARSELAREQLLYDIDESVIFEHLQESQAVQASVSDTEMENYILDHYSSSELSNNL